MCRTNSFLKERRSKVNQRIHPLWTRSYWRFTIQNHFGTQHTEVLRYISLADGDNRPHEDLVLFFGSGQLSLPQKTAMLCYLDRPNTLSVIELFCSTHMCFERASTHSTHDTASCLISHGSSTSWWNWGFIWSPQGIPSCTSIHSIHRLARFFLGKELPLSTSSQSCFNPPQVPKRN